MRSAVHLALLTALVMTFVLPATSSEVPMQSSPVSAAPAAEVTPLWVKESVSKMERELGANYGDSQRERVRRGVQKIAEFWHAEDGDVATFENFASTNFAER